MQEKSEKSKEVSFTTKIMQPDSSKAKRNLEHAVTVSPEEWIPGAID